MADNVELNSGSGGSTIRTDDDGTAHWQYVKVAYGADDTQNVVTSTATNPLPVALSDTDNAVLDSIDTDLTTVAAAIATEGSALGSGILLQGDDGTDRTNVLVDTAGHLQIDVLSAPTTTVTGTVAATQSGTWNVTNVSGTVSLPTGAATAANQSTANGSLADIETNTDFGAVVGGGAEATALRVTLANDSTGVISIDDGGNTITVDGTVTANLSATDNAVLDQIDSNTDFGATTGNGTAAGALRVTVASDSTGALAVDLGSNNDVQGAVAHDAAAASNPLLAAARATNSVEGLTQVAAADASYVTSDLNGCLVTRPHTTLEEIITERVSNTNGTSTAFTNFAAGGSDVHNYITTISIYNSSSTDGYVDFRDGTGGSIVFTAPAPQTGGSVINLPVPLKFAANTAVAYDVSGALSTVYISVIGFQAQG